jgi:hypothetical protein
MGFVVKGYSYVLNERSAASGRKPRLSDEALAKGLPVVMERGNALLMITGRYEIGKSGYNAIAADNEFGFIMPPVLVAVSTSRSGIRVLYSISFL